MKNEIEKLIEELLAPIPYVEGYSGECLDVVYVRDLLDRAARVLILQENELAVLRGKDSSIRVGDKVRVVKYEEGNRNLPSLIGQTGTVIEVMEKGTYPYVVEMDYWNISREYGVEVFYFTNEEIEKVS